MSGPKISQQTQDLLVAYGWSVKGFKGGSAWKVGVHNVTQLIYLCFLAYILYIKCPISESVPSNAKALQLLGFKSLFRLLLRRANGFLGLVIASHPGTDGEIPQIQVLPLGWCRTRAGSTRHWPERLSRHPGQRPSPSVAPMRSRPALNDKKNRTSRFQESRGGQGGVARPIHGPRGCDLTRAPFGAPPWIAPRRT